MMNIKTNNKNEFKQQILSISRTLLSRYGIEKITMNDIARELGKGKSTLYYYFSNKEQIVKAVMDAEVELLLRQIKSVVNSQSTPDKKLKSYVITRMKSLRKLTNFYSTFKEDYIRSYGIIQELRKRYDAQEMTIIRDILKEGVTKKVFSIKNIDLTAYTIVIALKGLEYPWSTETSTQKIEGYIDTLFGLLYHGIIRRSKE